MAIGGRRIALALERPGLTEDAARCAGVDAIVVSAPERTAASLGCPGVDVILALQHRSDRPASALRTTGLPLADVVSFKIDRALVSVWLTSVGEGSGRAPLAAVGEVNAASGMRIEVHWFAPIGAVATLAFIAALEDIYGRVFQMPATAEFLVSVGAKGAADPPPVHGEGSQAAALAVIAELRGQAVALAHTLAPGVRFRRWVLVQLVRASGQMAPDGFAGDRVMALRRDLQQWAPEPHAVAVTVRNDGDVPAEAQVSFSRDPHHVCSARIDADRVAACRLYDQHGHDIAAHVGQGASKTVATFSGAVREEVIFLPTTLVY